MWVQANLLIWPNKGRAIHKILHTLIKKYSFGTDCLTTRYIFCPTLFLVKSEMKFFF